MRILTTHTACNPLLTSLEEAGLRVDYFSDLNESINHQDWSDVIAYYGNLFDEIKKWPALIKLKKKLRSHNVPYIFWNRDAPWHTGIRIHNRIALKLINPIDIYLTHSLQDESWFGGVAYYFPNAAQQGYCQETNLHALRDEYAYAYDVSFFGSLGNLKDRNARLRAEFLEALGVELKRQLPGIRFHTMDTSRQPLTLNEQLRLIRSTKINLNVGAMCDLPGNPSWGLSERVFGIPAAGGFVISDVRQHQTDSFLPGLLPIFDSPQTCSVLIKRWLGDWNGLRDLAERQHQEVMARHTYKKRASELLDILKMHRASERVAA